MGRLDQEFGGGVTGTNTMASVRWVGTIGIRGSDREVVGKARFEPSKGH